MDVLEHLVQRTDRILPDIRSGSLHPGRNGPHNEPETPLRVSAHWLVSCTRLFELTGEHRFKEAAAVLFSQINTSEFLAGPYPVFRPQSKDKSNGVIGLGWLLEGLAIYGTRLGVEEAVKLAVTLARRQPFDDRFNMWNIVDENGTQSSLDQTLNHQIWFAVGCLTLHDLDSTIASQLDAFVDALSVNAGLSRSGLLRHLNQRQEGKKASIYCNLINACENPIVYNTLRVAAASNKKLNSLIKSLEYTRSKEVGYLIFTLHGLARLKSLYGATVPERLIAEPMRVILEDEFQARLLTNKWSYNYNPPGFEYPYIAFSDGGGSPAHLSIAARMLDEQIKHMEVMDRAPDATDYPTATARIYPLTLLNTSQLRQLGDAYDTWRSGESVSQ